MRNHLTSQGAEKIKVVFKDKLNEDTYWTKLITRALLAKFYHEQKVIGVVKGTPIVEI